MFLFSAGIRVGKATFPHRVVETSELCSSQESEGIWESLQDQEQF